MQTINMSNEYLCNVNFHERKNLSREENSLIFISIVAHAAAAAPTNPSRSSSRRRRRARRGARGRAGC